MSTITFVTAREITDSRGNPTVETTIGLASGSVASASVPSGASTGIHEALELRDGGPRFNGQGVLQAVSHITTEINNHLKGNDYDQRSLDNALIELDHTENKSRLGANAILGVSLAFARAVAQEQHVELHQYLAVLGGITVETLPQPMFNIINGGKHADSGLDIQEFMIGPIGFSSFHEKVRAAAEVIVALKKILHDKGYSVGVGDEGGFAPKLGSNEEAFDLIVLAITTAGYSTEQIKIAIDAAASSFYTDGAYVLKIDGQSKRLTSEELIDWYQSLVARYPVMSIEDGLDEEDWQGFATMTERLGKEITIVGDDLLVTNVARIQQAIDTQAVNAVLIKPNQIGTLSETIDAILLAKKQGWAPFVSHRSGETTDTFIADLSVGLACPFIKSGSLVRGERVCKYNRLMEIETSLLSKV